MQPVISISSLNKVYKSGYQALKEVNLEIEKGEIFALLGPNGAGKTTLISIICGIVQFSGGKVLAGGHDIVRDYRKSRSMIGLVPQELTTDAFETVWDTVSLSRGLFGRKPDPQYIERILRTLSLWDKRKSILRTLSGGMKRRVLIAKALSHEPRVLFLDEATSALDAESEQAVQQALERIMAGRTTIVITHRLATIRKADRIFVFEGGRLVETGTHASLSQEDGGLYRRLARLQLMAAE